MSKKAIFLGGTGVHYGNVLDCLKIMPIVSCFKRLTCLCFIHNGRSYYTAPAYMQKRAVSRPMNPRYGGFVRLVSAAHLVLPKGPVIIYWGGGGGGFGAKQGEI